MAFKPSIAVVGFSKREFNHLAHMLDRDDQKKVRFVCQIDDVRGMRFNQVIRMYDSYKVRDIEEIMCYLTQAMRNENGTS